MNTSSSTSPIDSSGKAPVPPSRGPDVTGPRSRVADHLQHKKNSPAHRVLSRWPAVLGAAAAVLQLATGVNRDAVAITLGVALLCYLGAAASGRPWIAWAGIAGGSLIVVGTELAGFPWWSGIAVAAIALVIIGLIGRVPRRPMLAQLLALVGFGGIAVAGLFLAPQVGLAVAGLALASHAVWDVIHLRRNTVVQRSLAEFCIVLDVPLGAAALILALTS